MFAKRTNWNLETNRLSAALAAHRAAGKALIDLTVSNPTECGFQYDEEAILSALRNPAALKYEPNPRGLRVARDAVAQYYAERGAAVFHDDMFLTTSTSEAYSYVFRTLCNPDDEVLIRSRAIRCSNSLRIFRTSGRYATRWSTTMDGRLIFTRWSRR
jgi:alanine-synthesizing transaminase